MSHSACLGELIDTRSFTRVFRHPCACVHKRRGSIAYKILSVFAFIPPTHFTPNRPYAFWITKMARMDKRLLETLRGVRTGEIQFKKVNPPHVQNLLTGLCEDLGLNPQMGMSSNVPFPSLPNVFSIGKRKKCPVCKRHAGRLIYLAILHQFFLLFFTFMCLRVTSFFIIFWLTNSILFFICSVEWNGLFLISEIGDFALRSRLPCEVVHQGITKSCEVSQPYNVHYAFVKRRVTTVRGLGI